MQIPEQYYNPYAGQEAFGASLLDSFKQSLQSEIQIRKMKQIEDENRRRSQELIKSQGLVNTGATISGSGELQETYARDYSKEFKDLDKNGMQVTGYDAQGRPIIRKKGAFDPNSPQGVTAALSLSEKYQDKLKDYNTVRQNFATMVESLNHAMAAKDETSKAAADQALVTAYNKMLDPTSVVREAEYDRTGDAQAITDKFRGLVEKIQQGGAGLTDENRKDAVKMAQRVMGAVQKKYQSTRKYYKDIAERFGMDSSIIIGEEMDMPQFNMPTMKIPNNNMQKFRLNGQEYMIPINEVQEFLNENPTAERF